MEEPPPIWKVVANILNKSSGQPTKGGPPIWGLGEVLTTPYCKKSILLRIFHKGLGTGGGHL